MSREKLLTIFSMHRDSETKVVRTQMGRTGEKEHTSPVFLTSSFIFDDAEHMRASFADEIEGNIYTRFTNPNNSEFVRKMCVLEGAEAGVATSSGMAAGFASVMGLLRSGDHIVSSRALFGGTHGMLTNFLPRWGITSTLVDIADEDQWIGAITPSTRMLLVETPSNPGLDLADLEFLGALARERNLILNVDNTFGTPLIQQPIMYGADLVWHSATKWIDGQGRGLGGVVLGRADLIGDIGAFCRNTGPSMSPMHSWLFSKSLETLPVRMDRHSANALLVAEFLEGHQQIERVKYPWLQSHPQYKLARKQMTSGGGVVAFCIKHDGSNESALRRATKFIDSVRMCSITANLGDTRTIVVHPTTSTHSKLTEEARREVGITPNMIRISVGLESIADIIEDLDQALNGG